MKHPLRWLTLLLLVLGFWVAVRPAPLPTRAAGPWYVAPTGSNTNSCLSAALPCATINGALSKPGFVAGDTIRVTTGIYTGTSISFEVVALSKNAMLSGGWNAAFTAQTGWSTVDGENARRGMTVSSGVTATVERFIIQHGAFTGAGVYNDHGSLTLLNCRIENNSAQSWPEYGGGIASNGTLHIIGSTIRNNSAWGYGGGLASYGALTIDTSSILYNSAQGSAGIFQSGVLTITNSTLAYNWGTALEPGSGATIMLNNVTILNNRGGVNTNGDTSINVSMRNSIVAGSTGGSDCTGSLTSLGYNLIGNTTGCAFTPGSGDLLNINPDVGDLYGSPGYFPLRMDSPAVNAGNPTGCSGNNGSLTTDQRGLARDGHCDIGAFEYVAPGAPVDLTIVNPITHFVPPNTADPRPLQVSVHDGQGNLVHNVTATFTAPSSGASGTFATTGTRQATAVSDNRGVATAPVYTTNNLEGEYTLGATVTGTMPVAFIIHNVVWYLSAETGSRTYDCTTPATPCLDFWQLLAASALEDNHVVRVAAGAYSGADAAVLPIDHSLKISGGWNEAFTQQVGASIIDGGHARNGIEVSGGLTVTLDRFAVRNALVGLNSAAASLTFTQGEISSSDQRGVQITAGHTRLSNVTSGSNRGGGLSVSTGATVTVASSTIAGNHADSGAGIRNLGGTVALKNSIVAGNTITATGGVDCAGTITSGGYNLIGHTTGCTVITATGDLLDVDPQLSAWLMGAPAYYALRSASPAIEAADPAGCTDAAGTPLTIDVRGVARTGRCDIGSYEYLTPTIPARLLILSGTPQNTRPTTIFPELLRVAVLDGQGSPVMDIPVIFTAPISGPGGIFSDTQTISTTMLSDQDGVTAAQFQANAQAGAYQVVATVTGTPPVSFNLFNAAAWYVSPTGSNGNSCLLPTAPCATLNGALIKAQPGDDIYVAGGSYSDSGEAVAVIAKRVQISGGWNAAFTAQTDTSVLDGQDQRRGVIVSPGVVASLSHFTVRNGTSGAGAGLYNAGDLTFDNAIFEANKCVDYDSAGGGVYNAGTLTMTHASLTGSNCYHGAGLFNSAGHSANLTDFTATGNYAWDGPNLRNHGILTLTLGTLGQAGGTESYGGGLNNSGQALVISTTFRDGMAYQGGGIFNTGNLVMRGSTVISNTADTYAHGRALGAGIFNSGQLLLESSVVQNNTGYDSIIWVTTPCDGPHGAGIYNTAVLTVNNSLITGNRVRIRTYTDDPPLGGGVYNAGTLELNNSTVVANAAMSGGNAGGLYNAAGTLKLHNTIVVSNTAEGSGPDCSGAITSGGYNLIGSTSQCGFSAGAGDLLNTSARFMPQITPIDYRLRYDSPAINAGDPAGCVDSIGLSVSTVDLRGLPRRVGRCDIGAVEMQALEASAVLVSRPHAINRTPISYTLQLRNLADVEVAGVVLTDRVPGAVIYQPDSLTATLGIPLIGGDLITWTGTLPASTTINIVFGASVSPAATGGSWITNTAYVQWDSSLVAPSAAFRVMSDLYLPTIAHNFCSDFLDDFSSSASRWPVGEDVYVRAQYLNGEYQLFSQMGGYLYGFASPACAQDLYRVEVDARWASAATSGDGYALLFDISSDFSRYGIFYVSADYGDFALSYRDTAGVHQIVPFTSSAAINRGAASNRLTVIRRAATVTLLVNGATLGTWSYAPASGFTRTGLAMQPYGSRPQADARFDNFAVYRQAAASATALTVKPASAATIISTSPAMRGFVPEAWVERVWSRHAPLGRNER